MTGYDWQAIRDRHPIADVVGSKIEIQKRGKEYRAICPFHPDRNPSFQIIPEKQFCYCPPCGWKGDVVKFIAAFQGIGIVDALRELNEGAPSRESPEIVAERKRQIEVREQEDAELKAKAIAEARQIWERAEPANENHPYLVRKQANAHSLRQSGDLLVLPIYDGDGEIQSIQTINPDGRKRFHPGAPVSHGRMAIGMGWDDFVPLCEGYATGDAINDATGLRTIVTYSMGNMEKVARKMSEAGIKIMLAADTGKSAEYMTELAEELGCPIAIPTPKEGSDFNDQAAEQSLDDVKAIFDAAIADHAKRCVANEPDSAIYRSGDGNYPFDISKERLTDPPGWIGKVTDWIESRNRRPRRIISVAGALTAIDNIAGLRYIDGRDGTTTNLFTFCIAGSRTGKESINQSVAEIHRVAGVAGATHGSIKSEKEIVENLVRHQSAFYVIDEIGDLLQKIQNAQKRGGAIYLDGVIAMLMSAYSKTDGYMLLTGDRKEEQRAALVKELAQFNRKADDDPSDYVSAKIAKLESQLVTIDNGLEKPFLSMIGFTTPVAFDHLVDQRSATNGFIGRSLIFNERDTAPRSKVTKGFRSPEMPMNMQMRIMEIASMDTQATAGRIEASGPRIAIECDDEADLMLEQALIWFEDQAVAHKQTSNLESLYLGAYELMSKISLILAIPDGVKRAEHVRWAFAMVVRDVDEKVRLVTANEREKDDPLLAMQARIVNLCAGDDGETLGVIYNRMRDKKRDKIDEAIADLVKRNALNKLETKHKFTKKTVVRFISKAS